MTRAERQAVLNKLFNKEAALEKKAFWAAALPLLLQFGLPLLMSGLMQSKTGKLLRPRSGPGVPLVQNLEAAEKAYSGFNRWYSPRTWAPTVAGLAGWTGGAMLGEKLTPKTPVQREAIAYAKQNPWRDNFDAWAQQAGSVYARDPRDFMRRRQSEYTALQSAANAGLLPNWNAQQLSQAYGHLQNGFPAPRSNTLQNQRLS